MPNDPYFFAQLKECIGMRLVGLGAVNLTIIHVPREAKPRVFSQHIPFRKHLALRREFHDHAAAGPAAGPVGREKGVAPRVLPTNDFF